MTHELAQVNIGRLAAPIESEQLAPFVQALDRINAEAELAPGFRWRLKSDAESAGPNIGATDVVAFQWDRTLPDAGIPDAGIPDAGIIVNLSVWADVESLRAFVFSGDHLAYLRRRREWFLPMQEAYAACWWVSVGHRPTTDEAEDRVRHLREHGPSAQAFELKAPFPTPN